MSLALKSVWMLSTAVAICNLGSVASAQDVVEGGQPQTTTDTASEPAGAASEVIVVTAQRRSENLQRTPVAVSAISSEALEQRAIVSQQDLQTTVPGLVVSQGFGYQINYAMRGQTVEAFTNSSSAVVPYLNEIPLPSNASAASFYDIQSIQVLKGPQGTLFGRNATGGAVLTTTVKPGSEFGGYVEQSVGNYDMYRTQAAINLPIATDLLSVRFATDLYFRDGFTRNLFNGERIGDIENKAVRGSFLLTPSSSLTNTTVIDYVKIDGSPPPNVLYNVYPVGATNNGIPLQSVAAALFSPFLDTLLGFPGAWAAYLALHPKVDPLGIENVARDQQARGPYLVDQNSQPASDGSNLIVSNITELALGEATLKNIFGYVYIKQSEQTEFDGSPYLIQGTTGPGTFSIYNNEQITNELQLSGKTLDDQLTYTIGGMYFHNVALTDLSIFTVDLSPIIPPNLAILQSKLYTNSYSGYAQGTFDLGDLTGVSGLSATAGARYTRESSRQEILPDSAFFNLLGLPNTQRLSDSKVSYQLGLQYQVDPQLLLYAVTRRSFRSGSFNVAAPQRPGTAAVGGNAYEPEIVHDIELGQKFQGELAGIPVRANAAEYIQWIDGVQRVAIVSIPPLGAGALTVNVPKAKIYGVELELQASPAPWLDLGISGAYTHAEFTENVSNVLGQVTTFNPYPYTPRWSGSVYAQVSKELEGLGLASLRADAYGQTKIYFGSAEVSVNPGSELPGYVVMNVRIALDEIAGSRFSLAAVAKNVTDKQYWLGGVPTGQAYGLNTAVPSDRRTVFATLRYEF